MPHWRLSRTDLVMESLAPSIIEQKVTGQEAFAGFRRAGAPVRRARPGPGGGAATCGSQPPAERIRVIASWEWLHLHVDPARSRALVRAATVADSLERLGRQGAVELDRGLRSLPGIGVWTSAEVRARSLGDPDAVSFGDYHVAKDVGWAVTGQPFSDEEMAEFLEPVAPAPWPGGRLPGHDGRSPAPARAADGAAHPPPGEAGDAAPVTPA